MMARFGALLLAIAVMVAVADAQLPPDANSPNSFLAPHNAARSRVGVAALRWNANLAAYALNYANSQRANCIPLRHSNGPYGENLFWGSGKAWTPGEAVASWVDEVRYYNAATNTCATGRVCGHYTQVVWRKTTDVGCASVLCNDRSVYIICSYYPPGNYVGQRPY